MLVDIMTAIIGPFGVCNGKPMQVEQMTVIFGRIRFFQRQAKSGLTIIGPIPMQCGWCYHLHSNTNRRANT